MERYLATEGAETICRRIKKAGKQTLIAGKTKFVLPGGRGVIKPHYDDRAGL